MPEKILKIVVVGPTGSGKSVLSNFFAEQIDLTKVSYSPTKGVRVLELDVKESSHDGSGRAASGSIPVQLWDIGGDRQHQQYWNALIYNADGAIMVCNADRASVQEKDQLETLLYFFNQRPQSAVLKPIPDSRILLLSHHHKSLSRSRFAQTSLLPADFTGKVKEIHTSLVDDTSAVRSEFERFVHRVYNEAAGRK
ncbi:hypothetical protein BV898_02012 [Hypsibius exemplaris]|uniref:Intraflagellar transport protein 22-like protein n=1 Tax=Hypsibius exemplaris TaxID=2072580 RepID=A0A1W0X9H7_HYPEX|nr:hypothetical protein BV898_02012 [Hypsibius exemplaris]